ncbi:MAG: hypothetical protein KJ583_04755 [Nanoarchaeota archaeon]|nr:hypothetical protein [Nanoarchaeota archaeon]MBU1269444.1 hypothetical protein [Nanoarchaeota archaeon]MBU1604601.1 hypothetical protein [Nanoarchaeota archaeon]MBU2442751.1 hypothetical protein [Nanoarchaeota archaeon]
MGKKGVSNKKQSVSKIKKGLTSFFEDDKTDVIADDKVSIKSLLIIFFIGLVIIIALYTFSKITKEESMTLTDQIKASENQPVKENVSFFIIDNFDYNNFSSIRFDPANKDYFELGISNDAYETNQSLKILVKPDIYDGDYLFVNRIAPVNLSGYVFFNFFYKSTDEFQGGVELADEDDWYRHTFRFTSKENWTLVTLPLNRFELMKFKSTEEGNLNGVIDYMIWWKRNPSSDFKKEQTVLIDKIFLTKEQPRV